jgi:hypothetical protein
MMQIMDERRRVVRLDELMKGGRCVVMEEEERWKRAWSGQTKLKPSGKTSY